MKGDQKMIRVAINGLGRIGRSVFKILNEQNVVDLVAVNDLVSPDNLAYLVKYDTVYGRYDKDVNFKEDSLVVDGKRIKILKEKDPEKLPWKDLDIDIVFECTGFFTKKSDALKHIMAGAKHVLISAPSKNEEVVTVVYGVNKPEDEENLEVISCASCTTNCITPIVEILGRRVGIKKAIMTTIHAYTASQSLVDSPNKKFRRGRAGAANFVPTTTGAAQATTRVLPQYKNKFDGVAVRGPVPVGSIADLVFVVEKQITLDQINKIFEEESKSERYNKVVSVSKDEVVSSDIIKDSHASIIDLTMTRVIDGDLVKIMSWYDNEWGYANQLVRESQRIAEIIENKLPVITESLT
jgi:glyceraldehyde 3-phosphate dehydrogenase (phosphorylating)